MKKLVKFAAVILAATTIVSCSKGDPEASFAVKQKDGTNRLSSHASFSEAMISISEIDFEIESGVDSIEDVEMEYEGNYSFDVLAGTAINDMDPVEIPAGTYYELEFETGAGLEGGHSIIVKGTLTDSATSYDFEFYSKDEFEYEIESEEGEPANEGDQVDFVLLIDLEALFTGLDFASATVDSNNVIIISETSNENLLDLIEERLEEAFEFESE